MIVVIIMMMIDDDDNCHQHNVIIQSSRFRHCPEQLVMKNFDISLSMMITNEYLWLAKFSFLPGIDDVTHHCNFTAPAKAVTWLSSAVVFY